MDFLKVIAVSGLRQFIRTLPFRFLAIERALRENIDMKRLQGGFMFLALNPFLKQEETEKIDIRDWLAQSKDEDIFDQNRYSLLLNLAKEWILERIDIDRTTLNDNDLKILQLMARYPRLTLAVIASKEVRDDAFAWGLRDRLSMEIFIRFPELQKKLVKYEISGRIARINPEMLRVQGDLVLLPFEGKAVNLLDETAAVTLKGNYRVTVKQFFHTFSRKHFDAGNLEISVDGVINWNTFKWARFDADKNAHREVDISRSYWWKSLPIVRYMSIKQAQSLYGRHMDGVCWNVAVTANRSYKNLNPLSNHAFQEVAIPTDDGRYAIFPFGKYGTEIPESFESITALPRMCAFVPATCAYPDPGYFYTHREYARYSYPLSEDQGRLLMSLIRDEMQRGRNGKSFYQIQSENCAKWVHELLETVVGQEHLPNLFFVHFLETEPVGAVATLFNTIKRLPSFVQTYVMTRLHHFLGAAFQGSHIDGVYTTLCDTHFWENGSVFLPAFLHKQQENRVFGTVHRYNEALERLLEKLRSKLRVAAVYFQDRYVFENVQKAFSFAFLSFQGDPKIILRSL